VKLMFEGEDILKICTEMERFLVDVMGARPRAPEQKPEKPEALKPKPKLDPHANADAKAAAAERMAKVRAAKAAKNKAPASAAQYDKEIHLVVEHEPKTKAETPPPSDPRSSDQAWEADKQAKLEGPDPFDEPETIDPVNLAALKVRTTEDLQAAYSNGKHKQVLALLSKYGNGAKSFRELQIQDFVPIRKAIDDGALA